YQYWALGHVHDFRVFPGAVPVVFPGNLQGRHIREQGEKGAVLVSCTDHHVESTDRLIVDVLRWQELRLDVSGHESRAEIMAAVGEALEETLRSFPDDKPCVLRLVLQGESPLYGQLQAERTQLRTDVVGKIAGLSDGRMWLEKLSLDIRPPRRAANEAIADDLAALLAE